MSSHDRYADYLRRHGVSEAAPIVEEGTLALGAFRMFRLDVADRELRAAASPAGLVTGARAPADAWWELLGAGDADQVADRIAWLESTRDVSRHARGRRFVVVRATERPPSAAVDPAVWRAAPAPILHTKPDRRELVFWFYTASADEPTERTVRTGPKGPATIADRPVHEIVKLGDRITRATAALGGRDAGAIQWALLVVTRERVVAAAPAVAKLLEHTSASIRGDAASTLAALADPRSVDALTAAAGRDTDDTAQLLEVTALGAIATVASAKALAALRPKLRGQARGESIHALSRIGTAALAEVRPALADAAAHDPDAALRSLAATYLKNLGP